MVQLISKGGFRERANRSRKYQNSENKQTTLNPTQYSAPQVQKNSESVDDSKSNYSLEKSDSSSK